MNKRVLVVPFVFFCVGQVVTLSVPDQDTRATWFGITFGGTIALAALVVVFETVRSTASAARTAALMDLPQAPPPRLRHDAMAEAVVALSRVDPKFSPARVSAHVDALFLAMQQAHQSGTLDDLHPWMSDGLFQRLSTQVRLLGAVVGRELLQGYALQSAVVNGAGLGEGYQSLQVRVTVAPLDAEAAHASQTQSWLFLRRLSATTQDHGLFDGRCPQCGSPLQLTASQRCAHCAAILNSGQHDWVLCDMSPGATTLARKAELLDVDGLRAKDSTLSPEELTDRAVLAFWRWYEALATGDARRLTRVSTERFRESLAPGLAQRTLAGVRVTVGGADLRLLRRRDGRDEASVVLWWSTGDGEAQQTVLELVRPVERAAAAQATGLASLRCEGCLAPMTDIESPACEHCGRPFTDAWRLDAMEPFASWSDAVRTLRHQLGPQGLTGWQTVPRHERLRALQLAAAVAKTDGQVLPSERALLERLTAEWGLWPDDLEAALAAEGPVSAAGLALPRAFARELLRQLVDLLFVDGRADLPERKLVERLAGSLGVQEEAQKLITTRVDALLKQLMK